MNANRGRNRDRPNQHQTEQTKTAKAVNTVSGDEARDSRPQNNRGGRSDRSNSNRGQRENSGQKQKVPYYCIHGRDKGHWTNECPLIKEKKEELERATNTEQPPKPVNSTHTNQPQGPPSQIHWQPSHQPHWTSAYPTLSPSFPTFHYNPTYTPPALPTLSAPHFPQIQKPFGATSRVAPTTPATNIQLPPSTSEARTRHNPRESQ